MKKIILLLGILALTATTASAQAGIGLNLYGGGGITLPQSDLKNSFKTGTHGMLSAGISAMPQLETAARFMYIRLPLKDESNGKSHLTIQEYGIDLRVKLAPPGFGFKPFALVGAGVAKSEMSSDQTIGLIEAKSKFFYAFGVGAMIAFVPKVNLFIEGRYSKVSVPDGNMTYIPITAGINVSL